MQTEFVKKTNELVTEMVQMMCGKGRKPKKENFNANPMKTQINPL
jgi:hypothetical protein